MIPIPQLAELGYSVRPDPDHPGNFCWVNDGDSSGCSFASERMAQEDASNHAAGVHELSQCQNCDKIHSEQTLQPVSNLLARVAPGEPMPSGECPDCGCLCQPYPSGPWMTRTSEQGRCREAAQHAHAEVDAGTFDRTTIPHRTIDAMCGLQLLSCAADHTEMYQRYNDETTLGRVRSDLHRELATGRLHASHLPDLQLSALIGPGHSASAAAAEL